MKKVRVRVGRTRMAVVAVVAVIAGSFVAGSAQAALAECPDVMPVADVNEGMTGTGYTVSKGSTPESFSVEVLGVLENGIGPGRDMIVVDVSSAAINEAGGIWAGMSGSPVYVNGDLIGAVAYGLSWGPSTIGGVTPAEDMLRIADRPTSMTETAPRKVRLTSEMRKAIADSTGTSARAMASSMKRLMTPLSVSGAGERVMNEIAKTIERENLPFIPYAGSSASAQQQAGTADPEPGGNFAAAISYGDVSFVGVGTTTYVCDGKVLAFGHPFFFYPTGETVAGANDAHAIAIIADEVYGSYKLANAGAIFGTLDQDRFAGVRALLGDGPVTIPVTSSVQTVDGLASRDGQSDVVGTEYVPMVALSHALSNIDFTWDQIDEGSSELSWTITGVTKAGTPFSLERTNLFADLYDISYASLFEMQSHLYALLSNGFEDIEFTGVDVDATIDDEVRQYSLAKVLVSPNGVDYEAKRRVRIKRGGTVYLELHLEPYGGTEDTVLNFEVEVPKDIRRGAFIDIAGGQGDQYYDYYCFIEPEACGGMGTDDIESLEDLIAHFESAPTNDELSVKLYGSRGGLRSTALEVLDRVIQGRRSIRVIISGGGTGSGSGGGVIEPAPPEG